MTKSYTQLVKQIDVLKRQADQVRKKEVAGVVERMKVAIEFYGLTPEDLFGGKSRSVFPSPSPKLGRPAKSASKAKTASATPKYSDGAGNVWAGRGPRPQWLRTALESGKSLLDFVTGGATASSTAPESDDSSSNPAASAKSTSKKYVSAVKYRDEAGHEWSGRGPKPAWVKDALAAGKKIEDLAA